MSLRKIPLEKSNFMTAEPLPVELEGVISLNAKYQALICPNIACRKAAIVAGQIVVQISGNLVTFRTIYNVKARVIKLVAILVIGSLD